MISSSIKLSGAFLRQVGAPLEVSSDLLVAAPTSGQVLVKLSISGVCHSQLMEARGKRGKNHYLPHLLGHEGTGQVLAIGPEVTKVKPGDAVILGWIKGNGMDVGGGNYTLGDERINAGAVTTFNSKAVVSENRVFPLPEGLPENIAVLFGCSALTGAGMLLNEIKPRQKGNLAVIGLGGIGLCALMTAGLHDFEKVIAVDISDEKLALAKLLGATHLINASRNDVLSSIREMTGGKGVDFSVEAAGQTATIEKAFASVKRNGGLCIFASHPEAGSTIAIDPFDLICGKNIRGSWGGACHPDRDIVTLTGQYLEGNLPLEHLISEQYDLTEINVALDNLEAGKSLRPLIRFEVS